MAYSIHPFTSEFVDRVKDFNRRLEAGGVSYRSSEDPVVKNFEHGDVAIRSENFVVCDDAVDHVCGSYTLVHYPFVVRGVPANFAYIQIPLSEGTVNPKYGAVGALILRDILRRYPVTFGLGMGGIDNPLPRALKAMRFQLDEVPFYFHVAKGRRFLANISPLRSTPGRRAAATFARLSGLGPLGIHLAQGAIRIGSTGGKLRTAVCKQFDEAADEVWSENRERHTYLMQRTQHSLNYLYPPQGGKFHCLYFYSGDRMVGWAALLNTQMSGHKYFGDMRVATIVDSLAVAGFETGVLRESTKYLLEQKTDLIVCNQMSTSWKLPFRSAGYFSGPSNFGLAQSPALLKLSQPPDAPALPIHLMRGDGDGPYNL